jgi:MFS family permease
MIIGNIVFGKLSDRIGRKLLISVGALVGGISLFLFMMATELTGFYVAGIALGIGIAMRGPTIQALIADLTDRRAYGTIMGFFGAVML